MSGKTCVAWSVLAILGVAGRPVMAADVPAVTIENVRPGFSGNSSLTQIKVGAWNPVWVDLKAGPARFQGFVEITTPDDNGTPTLTTRQIDLAPDSFTTTLLYVRPGSRNGEMNVRVSDGRRDRANFPGPSVDAFGAETSLVLTAGNPSGVAEMKDLPKFQGMASTASVPFLVQPIRPSDPFPGRWYGFDAADVVVLDTNDPSVMSRINASSQSLREWVRLGGHLVVSVGANWQAVKDSPLGPMLPGVPAGRIRLNDPRELESFAGNSTHPIKDALQVTKFEDFEARGGIPLASTASTPLVIRGPFGFGRITIIGVDVDLKPFATWEDRRSFWDKALDLRGRGTENLSTAVPGAFRMANSDLASLLHESLERFPGVRLVPFGWVAFFVFLYILLIGPGDYFFLRKVVKRMELTWITFPLIVITVSTIAYVAAYAFKGTELRINKVDSLDVDQTSGLVRGTTWMTLFSPQNRDYGAALVPVAIEAEPPAEILAPASARPMVSGGSLITWFGAPETGFGGNAGLGLGGSGYMYGPPGEVEQVSGVRVAIWSTKSFTGRWWSNASAPVLNSDLTPSGPDRIGGTITNVSKRPMTGATLLFGRYAYPLGDGNLAPGQTATINAMEARPLSSYLSGKLNLTQNRPINYGYGANNNEAILGDDLQAEAQRPDLVRSILFHDGIGQQASNTPSLPLKALDLTGLLDLRRPMLVATVDGPATQVKLDGASGPPKIKQLTILRVILPIKEGADPAP